MTRQDIVFATSRFNISEVRDHFINPCCFGEDVAAWLKQQIERLGGKVSQPQQEDWGWYLDVEHVGNRYFIGVGGNAEEGGETANCGEWRLMVGKKRSIWQKITGANPFDSNDRFFAEILKIVQAQEFTNIRLE